MNHIKLRAERKELFKSKNYRKLSTYLIALYMLFSVIYLFRGNLYEINNPYITLFAGTAPNLFPSFLFTLIGVFYAAPAFVSSQDLSEKSSYVWIVNALNIAVLSLMEYMHVVLESGAWDNYDIIASIIGALAATAVYFKIRKTMFANDKEI